MSVDKLDIQNACKNLERDLLECWEDSVLMEEDNDLFFRQVLDKLDTFICDTSDDMFA